jgi:hypothetical protein
MANKHRKIDPDRLLQLANEYCLECLNYTKEHATGSGKVVEVKERKIPTIKFFILFWLQNKDVDMYTREHFYLALSDDKHPLYYTLKKIKEAFDGLAEDIVCNEGKGIFWAKNRLGFTDQMQSKVDSKIEVEFKDMSKED